MHYPYSPQLFYPCPKVRFCEFLQTVWTVGISATRSLDWCNKIFLDHFDLSLHHHPRVFFVGKKIGYRVRRRRALEKIYPAHCDNPDALFYGQTLFTWVKSAHRAPQMCSQYRAWCGVKGAHPRIGKRECTSDRASRQADGPVGGFSQSHLPLSTSRPCRRSGQSSRPVSEEATRHRMRVAAGRRRAPPHANTGNE